MLKLKTRIFREIFRVHVGERLFMMEKIVKFLLQFQKFNQFLASEQFSKIEIAFQNQMKNLVIFVMEKK